MAADDNPADPPAAVADPAPAAEPAGEPPPADGPADPAPAPTPDAAAGADEAAPDEPTDHVEPGPLPGALQPDPSAVELPDPQGLVGTRTCPLCDGHGQIPYGILQSPRTHRCDECGGIGEIYTGSLNPDAAVAPCEACNGAGYKSVRLTPTDQLTAAGGAVDATQPPWPGATWNADTASWS